MKTYVVAAIHPWNAARFHEISPSLPGRWILFDDPASLTDEKLAELSPRYVFFPHWSAKVPDAILQRYECVCFHMTDVPYGRGGSPLQNLIVRGHDRTRLTALRMVAAFDAGPVYQKRSLLLHGPAQSIYERVALLVWDMIADIVAQEPVPQPQSGDTVVFKRRTPAQSELPLRASLKQLYDHIRMLDAEGYPHAFCEIGENRLLFTNARLNDGELTADVRFETRKIPE